MAEPMKISTKKYTNNGKVDIDGNLWSVKLPGAGTELRFSQASRACKLYLSRLELIDKKIDAGTVTESDLDKYEDYSKKYEENERVIYDIFANTFVDDTDDNSDVKKWVDETPTSIIMLAFEDVRSQAHDTNAEKQA
jgi:hypothetical protein